MSSGSPTKRKIIDSRTEARGVEYLAHIGGFIFGAVTARFFEDQRRLALQPPGD